MNSASDDPELVMETLLQFEREEGDLASYEAAREKCTAQLKRLEKRKEKVNTCYGCDEKLASSQNLQ